MYLLSCLHICMVYVNLYHHLGPAYYTFISPIMLCRSALKILSFMLKNNCGQTIMLFIHKFVWIAGNFWKTALLEWICEYSSMRVYHYTLLDDDCSIRVYKSFPTIFCKHMNIAISVFYIFPTMLALCLMFAMTHYVSIIDGSLITFPW